MQQSWTLLIFALLAHLVIHIVLPKGTSQRGLPMCALLSAAPSALFSSSSQVDWQKGDAFNPDTFAHLFPKVDGVVHTLGILLEDGEYKQAVRNANFPQLLSSLFRSVTGDTGNPLRKGSAAGGDRMTYETMNKTAGSSLRVLCWLYFHLTVTQHFKYAKRSSPLFRRPKSLTTRGHLFMSLQKISSDHSFLPGI